MNKLRYGLQSRFLETDTNITKSQISRPIKTANNYFAAFTYVGLTTREQTKSLQKVTFLLSNSRNILFVKWIESLLHTASKKFEF